MSIRRWPRCAKPRGRTKAVGREIPHVGVYSQLPGRTRTSFCPEGPLAATVKRVDLGTHDNPAESVIRGGEKYGNECRGIPESRRLASWAHCESFSSLPRRRRRQLSSSAASRRALGYRVRSPVPLPTPRHLPARAYIGALQKLNQPGMHDIYDVNIIAQTNHS